MNKSKGIKIKCLDCSCGSPKEVTLCHIVDCGIWPYRCGYSVKDKRYKKRMEAARKKYPKEYQDMLNLVTEYAQNVPFLLQYVQIDSAQQKKQSHEDKTIQSEIRA